jgi:peptide/nickel transport system permease protein
VEIVSGAEHYAGRTSQGRVLAWGGNILNQLNVPKGLKGATEGDDSGASKLYGCSFQTYAVDKDGKLVGKWGSKGHIFGTDRNGADILQRIIQGGRMTMTIGAIAVIISTVIGIIIGCVSGYFGGKVDMILMRVTEIFAAIPFLPFALILSAIMAQMNITENQKIFLLMVILGLLTWTGLARMVRGQVLVARENEYVTAAKAMGVRESTIAFKHILPNIVSIIFVSLTLDFATCLLTESGLSYLGFGVTFPRPTWGNMLNGANNATIIKNYWWQWVFPSIFLAITCICINVVGDALRDVMDPKSDRDK